MKSELDSKIGTGQPLTEHVGVMAGVWLLLQNDADLAASDDDVIPWLEERWASRFICDLGR